MLHTVEAIKQFVNVLGKYSHGQLLAAEHPYKNTKTGAVPHLFHCHSWPIWKITFLQGNKLHLNKLCYFLWWMNEDTIPYLKTPECKFPLLLCDLWLYWDTSSYPHRQSLHFISNLCTETYTSSSPHINDLWTNLYTKVCSIICFGKCGTCVVHQFCKIYNASVLKDLFFGVMPISNTQWS